jgi:hypothetical protein
LFLPFLPPTFAPTLIESTAAPMADAPGPSQASPSPVPMQAETATARGCSGGIPAAPAPAIFRRSAIHFDSSGLLSKEGGQKTVYRGRVDGWTEEVHLIVFVVVVFPCSLLLLERL